LHAKDGNGSLHTFVSNIAQIIYHGKKDSVREGEGRHTERKGVK